MSIRNITSRYINTDNPMGVFEIDLHDLWYLCIETAKITPVKGAAADQLVAQLVAARQLGHIRRPDRSKPNADIDRRSEVQHAPELEHAVTSSNERMWTDLPFLVTDLRAAWANSVRRMSQTECENLAGFTGRLATAGVCDPHLTSCALILFREALETPRRILGSDKLTGGGPAHETPLSEYLPAVLAWLWYGSYQILDLCARNHLPTVDDSQCEDWTTVGESLAADSEATQKAGFTMLRWQFWKRQLKEIERHVGDKAVAEQGGTCARIMERWEDIMGRAAAMTERDAPVPKEQV
ncbi:hypothetical protein LTR36_007764 [Oleoguttula mirabilis]|uniref:Uncharacterized protein n=1 Tax=Oleoguttula mirabilis TaxID=1507867 RepID=A0AAV9JA02_9PEZI|nr:hypothetical protein LTR36_007764 [Oleoguttula mirabilis]